MANRKWYSRAASAGPILFGVAVCMFICRGLLFTKLYGKHDDLLVGIAEVGLIMSVAAFVLTAIDMRKIWRVVLAILSLVLAYVWFISIAWWVMVK